ncbi:venom protease-like [Macrobrachium rosenbergii]|uniref:venom protease-like n=1 Tax=Macrobrachium rosenbergii TaxID=79674 RepID=UPI0034D5C981
MAKLSLFSLLLLSVYAVKESSQALNLAEVECGHPKAPFVRIKNGVDALVGEFPWHVALHIADANNSNFTIYTCVGAIIHKRFVLTAAHCVQSWKADDLVAVFGSHSQSKPSKFERRVQVENVIVHPSYLITGSQVYNDIALLELTEDITWNRLVLPVCLPDEEDGDHDSRDDLDSDPLVGRPVIVAGWGMTDEIKEGGELADSLQKVELEVLPLTKCREWIQESLGRYYPLRETQLCAGFEEGLKDACTGDSGGPLLLRNEENQLVAIGVVSTGFGCGRPRQPGLYTRVSKFLDWIIDTIEDSGHYVHNRVSEESDR